MLRELVGQQVAGYFRVDAQLTHLVERNVSFDRLRPICDRVRVVPGDVGEGRWFTAGGCGFGVVV